MCLPCGHCLFQANIEGDPIVYVTVPKNHSRSILQQTVKSDLITVGRSGALGLHIWTPYDRVSPKSMTFERDPTLVNSRYRTFWLPLFFLFVFFSNVTNHMWIFYETYSQKKKNQNFFSKKQYLGTRERLLDRFIRVSRSSQTCLLSQRIVNCCSTVATGTTHCVFTTLQRERPLLKLFDIEVCFIFF